MMNRPQLRTPVFSRPPFLLRALRAAALWGPMAAAGLLSGCAERPVATSFLTAPQYKMETAAHWVLVAKDVSSAVSAYLQEQTGQKPPVQVYLTRHGDTLFADAFQQAVTTAFVQNGHAVAMEPKPDVVMVAIDVLPMAHPRIYGANHSVPGPLTALGAGVAVGRLMWDAVPWGITAAAAGLALDTARATVDETNTELMLTVSISRDGYFIYRSQAVYYVDDDALAEYLGGPGPGPGASGRYRSFNDVPEGNIGLDLAHKPYVIR
ncbi:hypothetical protein [Nitrospirillum iridis]|uniref:Lipoprotein n=1 Tax=Nitrospirillum iridis TaxID=765888 RepID=A0A7X0EG96_9PROT|nr:hypothetical protein [Nitrospirillum iridis]MBB6253891.1 hypothetical protein [Nitrospirillum iridis]